MNNFNDRVVTVANYIAPIFILLISILADLTGYYHLAIFTGSLWLPLFVYQLDWPRKELGLEIERWTLWFSVECFCWFFFVSSFHIPLDGYIFDTILPELFEWSLWPVFFNFLRVFSFSFILFRHFYLVPKRLQEYFDKKVDLENTSKLREYRRKMEGALLILCFILGLGFGTFLEAILLLSTIFVVFERLNRNIRRFRSKSSLQKVIQEYTLESRGFWTHFFEIPSRFIIALLIISFIYFLNLPSWDFFLYQDLIMVILLSLALFLMAGILFYNNVFKITQLYLTLILFLIAIFAIISGEPEIFPYVRLIIRDPNLGIQYILVFIHFWLICICIFLLNIKVKQNLNKPKVQLRKRVKQLSGFLLFIIFSLVIVTILILFFGDFLLPQLNLLLIFVLAFISSFPLIKWFYF